MKNAESGFSLIEVMVGVAILITTAYYLTTVTVASTNQQAVSKNYINGTLIAESTLDSLLSSDNDDLRLTPGDHSAAYTLTGMPAGAKDAAYYTATWTVKADTPKVGIIKIDLVVTWSVNGFKQQTPLFTFRNM